MFVIKKTLKAEKFCPTREPKTLYNIVVSPLPAPPDSKLLPPPRSALRTCAVARSLLL